MSLHVTLPAASYWKLRFLQSEREKLEHQAVAAIRTLQQEYAALLHELADAHGFDPTVNYQWDNARCALVAPELAA